MASSAVLDAAEPGNAPDIEIKQKRSPIGWIAGWWLFTLVYFALGILVSRGPYWYDELFTLYLSQMPAGHLWKALLAGVDQNTPVFFWLSAAGAHLMPTSDAGLRLPALIGGWVAHTCIFLYVRRSCGAAWGWAASLLLLTCGASYYFVEARPYGMLVGWSGLALLAWQRRALRLMTVALALAALSHAYSLVVFLPFVLGEIARRQFDRRAWLGFTIAGAVYAVYLPIHNGVNDGLHYTWAKPEFSKIPEAYLAYVGSALPLVFGLVLIFACWSLLVERDPTWRAPEVPRHEAVALVSMMLLPLAGLALGKVTGMYTPRYTVEAVVALVIVYALLGFRISQGKPALAMLVCVVTFGWEIWSFWSVAQRQDIRHLPAAIHESDRITGSYDLLPIAERSNLPLVASSGLAFLELDHYVSDNMAGRLHMLLDPAAAIEHTQVDLFDVSLPKAVKWFPVRGKMDPYGEFIQNNRRFLVLGFWDSTTANDWLVDRLLKDGAHLQALGKSDRAWRSYYWATGIPDMRYIYLFDVTFPDGPTKQQP